MEDEEFCITYGSLAEGGEPNQARSEQDETFPVSIPSSSANRCPPRVQQAALPSFDKQVSVLIQELASKADLPSSLAREEVSGDVDVEHVSSPGPRGGPPSPLPDNSPEQRPAQEVSPSPPPQTRGPSLAPASSRPAGAPPPVETPRPAPSRLFPQATPLSAPLRGHPFASQHPLYSEARAGARPRASEGSRYGIRDMRTPRPSAGRGILLGSNRNTPAASTDAQTPTPVGSVLEKLLGAQRTGAAAREETGTPLIGGRSATETPAVTRRLDLGDEDVPAAAEMPLSQRFAGVFFGPGAALRASQAREAQSAAGMGPSLASLLLPKPAPGPGPHRPRLGSSTARSAKLSTQLSGALAAAQAAAPRPPPRLRVLRADEARLGVRRFRVWTEAWGGGAAREAELVVPTQGVGGPLGEGDLVELRGSWQVWDAPEALTLVCSSVGGRLG